MKSKNRIRTGFDLRSVACVVLLLALGFGFALVPLAQGKLFFYWDNASQHYPVTEFLHNALRSGRIPHWWPEAGFGFPVVGEGAPAHYHPVKLLLALIFSAPVAFMVEIGFYLAAAGVSTYFFLRKFWLLRAACVVGALCQMFGSYSLIAIGNISMHRSLCFLPLTMLLAECFVRRRKISYAILASIVLGVQLLGGYPTSVFLTIVATVTYILCRLFQRSWHLNRSLRPVALEIANAMCLWGVGILLAFGVASIQVLPTLLHVNHSFRKGGLKFEYAVITSLPAKVKYLPQLIFPYVYEHGDWLDVPKWWGSYFNEVPYMGFYIGALPVLLALLALWWHRSWPDPGWPLAATGTIATILSLGAQTPLFPALWSLPVISGFRFPSRFLIVTSFCLSSLAALGLHRLLARNRLGTVRVKDALPFIFLAGSLVTLAVLFWTQRSILSKTINVAPDTGRGILISLVLFATAFALTVGLLLIRPRRYRTLLLGLVIVFVLIDLAAFRVRAGYVPAIAVEQVKTPSPAAQFLKTDQDRFRVMSLISVESFLNKDEDLREFVQANVTIWGIESAEIWASLYPKRYYALHEAILWELSNSPEAANKLAGFLAALNVKYVAAPKSIHLEGWQVVFQTARASIWRNPILMPRAFLVGHVTPENIEVRDEWFHKSTYQRLQLYHEMVADWFDRIEDAQIIDNILTRNANYQTTAIVAGSHLPQLSGIDESSLVIERSRQVDEMTFQVSSRKPALLVIANNYYPGWTATVNGKESEIFRTNYVEMGVAVPEGTSQVVLRFVTPGFRLGLLVSTASLSLCLLWLASPGVRVAVAKLRNLRSRRHRHPDVSSAISA